jgi:hypothetical protein
MHVTCKLYHFIIGPRVLYCEIGQIFMEFENGIFCILTSLTLGESQAVVAGVLWGPT